MMITNADKNAAIARAMGWRISGDRGMPPNSIEVQPVPAYDTDAAASRGMVEWLKTQSEATQDIFASRLMLSLRETQDAARGGDGIFWGDEILAVLSAPLPLLRDAAFEAIGGNEDER
jgi:hypothetical protein